MSNFNLLHSSNNALSLLTYFGQYCSFSGSPLTLKVLQYTQNSQCVQKYNFWVHYILIILKSSKCDQPHFMQITNIIFNSENLNWFLNFPHSSTDSNWNFCKCWSYAVFPISYQFQRGLSRFPIFPKSWKNWKIIICNCNRRYLQFFPNSLKRSKSSILGIFTCIFNNLRRVDLNFFLKPSRKFIREVNLFQ